jgi:hypothetical protein
LDEDLGGNKFNVVVIFIDQRESEEDLRAWREKFASDVGSLPLAMKK